MRTACEADASPPAAKTVRPVRGTGNNLLGLMLERLQLTAPREGLGRRLSLARAAVRGCAERWAGASERLPAVQRGFGSISAGADGVPPCATARHLQLSTAKNACTAVVSPYARRARRPRRQRCAPCLTSKAFVPS